MVTSIILLLECIFFHMAEFLKLSCFHKQPISDMFFTLFFDSELGKLQEYNMQHDIYSGLIIIYPTLYYGPYVCFTPSEWRSINQHVCHGEWSQCQRGIDLPDQSSCIAGIAGIAIVMKHIQIIVVLCRLRVFITSEKSANFISTTKNDPKLWITVQLYTSYNTSFQHIVEFGNVH